MSTPPSRWTPRLAALDANLLVALDALLQESNVTRAAQRVGITQSAMSQTLARLRHQFEDPILVKVGRRMEPSPFGLRLKARLHGAIAELEAIVGDRPAFDPGTANDRFVLAMVDYLSLLLFPKLAAAVAARAPGVDLAVRALDAEPVTPLMQRGVVHLYVGVAGQTERALQTRLLFSDPLRVVARRGHPLAKGRMSVRAYAEAPHILVSPRQEAGSLVTRALAAAGYARRVALEVPYFSLVPSLVVGSDRIATVPERMARAFAAQHPLQVLTPPLPLPPVEICMAWHPAFASEASQVWLRELVAQVAS